VKLMIEHLTQEFTYSVFPNSRNGGLIGLAAVAIALGPDVVTFLGDLIPPVLSCLSDQDSRVRYYACESLYNIAKVGKVDSLQYFNEIFDSLSKVRFILHVYSSWCLIMNYRLRMGQSFLID
jgi:vacuole morphology and inheritance protein 14